MKKLLLTLLLAFLTIGVVFPNLYGEILNRVLHGLQFGAISFPTSLDVFENPGATQSVATVVTHSTHHGNANDALEAIEAKIGISASTPTANTVFYSGSTGNSTWSGTPSITTLTATGLGRFGNLWIDASSTLQNFTFVNATGTSATTTNFFSTTASTTNLFGQFINGFSLSTCNSASQKLTWSGGSFGCGTDSTGAASFGATSTATTTISGSFTLSETVALTAGDSIVIWASAVMPDNTCQTGTIGLEIKPASLATSTMALAFCDLATSDDTTLPLFGLYNITTTENHEIYIGEEETGNKGLQAIGFGTILYQIVEP